MLSFFLGGTHIMTFMWKSEDSSWSHFFPFTVRWRALNPAEAWCKCHYLLHCLTVAWISTVTSWSDYATQFSIKPAKAEVMGAAQWWSACLACLTQKGLGLALALQHKNTTDRQKQQTEISSGSCSLFKIHLHLLCLSCVCVHTMFVFRCSQRPQEGSWSPRTGVTDSSDPPCKCWELSPGLLEEQKVTTEA